MASYPTAVKSFTTKNAGDTIQPADVNDLQDEVNAIEAGLLNGTAPLHSSNSTLINLSVPGNSTLASTITIGTASYIFPSSNASTGQVLTAISSVASAMRLEWRTPQVLFVAGANGSDTNAAANTVASQTIAGLTANDELQISYELEASSQNVGSIFLNNATDGVNLISISAGTLLANTQVMGRAILRQRQANSTTIAATAEGLLLGTSSRVDNSASASVATGWTGTWALALRHSGVTAGGTLKWAWQVYKRAGQ